MAIGTGTLTTYATIGIREQLMDKIFNISPDETPFLSSLGKLKATNVKPEWQTDTLAAASDSSVLEGDLFAYTAPAATVRVNNYCQINRKTQVISGTDDVVNKAGRATETGYQLAKQAKILKTDMELAMIGVNQASVAGTASVIRKSGSMSSWLTSNVSRGAGGANGGFTAGLTVAATDGTQRAFAEAQIKSVMQSAFSNGGKPTMAFMAPGQKVAFSAFAGIAVNRIDNSPDKKSEGQLAIMGAADVYKSDFGNLTAMPDNFCRARDVYLVDKEYAATAYLRPLKTINPGIDGDAVRKVLLVEWSLIMKNQAAHGVIADLT